MRIEKLARWVLATVGLSMGITACDVDRAKYEKQCLAEEHTKPYYKKITILFPTDYDSLKLNSVHLYHIRNGSTSELSYTRDGNYLNIANLDLFTRDTLIVRVNDSAREFVLHDFKSSPRWGGKNFLGCYLFTFKINGKESALGDWSRISIPGNPKS